MSADLLVLLIKFAVNILNILYFCIFLTIIFSWFSVPADHPVVRFINGVSAPVLNLAKKVPLRIGMFDLSPILAILAISFLQQFLMNILVGI
jgi:YggT family protein